MLLQVARDVEAFASATDSLSQVLGGASALETSDSYLNSATPRAEIIESYPKNEINIRISGTNKKPLLEIIRHEFWKIHESYERLDYKELIPCNCTQCKGSNKPEFYPYDLLMKYLGDHRYDIECRISYEKVDVRRLISDITDQLDDPHDLYTKILSSTSAGTHSADKLYARDITNSIVILGNDNHANLELTQTAHDIKSILNELSEEYNPNSAKGQAKIKDAALAEIKQNPTLKQRTIKALQSAGDEALEQAISHPVAKVVVKGVQGFLQS